jgi:hypothetical protein
VTLTLRRAGRGLPLGITTMKSPVLEANPTDHLEIAVIR